MVCGEARGADDLEREWAQIVGIRYAQFQPLGDARCTVRKGAHAERAPVQRPGGLRPHLGKAGPRAFLIAIRSTVLFGNLPFLERLELRNPYRAIWERRHDFERAAQCLDVAP